jgi:hypothetical protein
MIPAICSIPQHFMAEPSTIRLFEPRKLVLQILFWLVGLALLGWIIHRAIRTGDWERLWNSDPRLILMLIGCTAASWLFNGATFWITIQPVRRIRLSDMLLLNLVGNMLNYAPIRAGAIARILYHHRVDRLGLLQIGAWFGMIAYILLLGVTSCIVATMLWTQFDLIWIGLVLGQITLGALATRAVVGHPLIVRHGRGIDRLFRNHLGLIGATSLRILDIAAFAGRMYAALLILGIELPITHAVILAVVALAASLIPFGRMGFREFCVAVAAAKLGELSGLDNVPWEQMALVESAGEAIFYIPLGIIAMRWYRRRWLASSKATHMDNREEPS